MSTFASSCGPKSDTVARTGTPGPDAAEREELDGEAGGVNGMPSSAIRFSAGRPPSPGAARPGEVALDVGDEDRHAGGRELLGDALQRLGLARAGRARDQAVAVHHRQRHLHDRLGRDRAVVDAAAELDRPGPSAW